VRTPASRTRHEQDLRKEIPDDSLHCDFIFISTDALPRVRSVRVDRDTGVGPPADPGLA
jgi:hypothetical protein